MDINTINWIHIYRYIYLQKVWYLFLKLDFSIGFTKSSVQLTDSL